MSTTKPYTVEVFDNFDHPNKRCIGKVGEFDSLPEAIACAQRAVDESLERMRRPGLSASQWYHEYSAAGDGVYLLGTDPTNFNPYHYAKARIEALTGERPKDYGEK